MAIALEVHRASVEEVHDQAAAERELVLGRSRVPFYNVRVLLPDYVDEKIRVIAFYRHVAYSFG
ncbi:MULTISPECIES: hypothetical protein [Pseudomonas]|uniref:hypothetical protein n=1 Tax=Pseudomonas TaxID=286 RepID=UPI001304B127|nr:MULTISPECIES: hypothetical protein [Pseudomonas]QXN52216.1 hypothetical protein KW062_10960 [Pseudomonas fluorescens]WSO26547.1 hypothetical protein VUJ50_11020 [Pseudomonas fluorescens]